MRVACLVIASFLLVRAPALGAESPGSFGFEFTVSPEDVEARRLLRGNHPAEFWQKLVADYAYLCQELGCEIEIPGELGKPLSRRGFHIVFPDEFWIGFKPDKFVLEIVTPKLSLDELAERTALFETHVLTHLKQNFKLIPLRSLGGGHVSMDVLSHFEDLGQLLDFVEDSIRHLDMFRYISRDPSRPIGTLDADKYEYLRRALDRARKGARAGKPFDRETFFILGLELENILYAKETGIAFHFVGNDPATWRIEFRTPKPQQSIEEALRFGELLTRRKEYLRKNPPKPGLPAHAEWMKLNSAAEAEPVFVKYVSEMGDRVLHYLPFLRSELVESFRAKYCGKTLSPDAD